MHPDALEAIISINPKFNKLRNPLLRKLMAPRTSIQMACVIGGCEVSDFYRALAPLGFIIDSNVPVEQLQSSKPRPKFMNSLDDKQIVTIDVRVALKDNLDPIRLIMEKIKTMTSNQTLKIINSFEPIPLIHLLEKQGYESYSECIREELYYTYFHSIHKQKKEPEPLQKNEKDWNQILEHFSNRLIEIDVRQLEMPLPMMTILDEIEKLPKTKPCMYTTNEYLYI